MNAQTPSNPTELLQAMVRINSVNPELPGSDGGESALVDALQRLAVSWGMTTRRLPVPGMSDQLLILHEVGVGPWLLFDSHLDTVAVEGMTIDPFGGECRDGRVWGRGACDTKGTGAAMLWALHRYTQQARAGESPNNIALLFSIDEEVSMRGIRSFIEQDLPGLGWRPDAAIVGEPTELRPVIAHNGCLRWRLTTKGLACHSSIPHEGRSAIRAMATVISALHEQYLDPLDARHPLTGPAVGSINTVRGGSAPNIVADTCTIEIDRRLLPGEEPDVQMQAVKRIVDALTSEGQPVEYEQQLQVFHPPLGTDHNGELTRSIQHALGDLGLPTLCLGAPFSTHACYFDEVGIPAVVWGPGSPHPAHTEDEWVAVEQIDRGAEAYLRLMRHPLPVASA